ncbi:hypothetical protein HPB52_004760 [Rhipicephalus sanguineus]|uniref:Uncharacterized protein n=1 Tax=Rhipicephalus sanguineus TaxID=34632 RepID=A0A9D4Q9W3_RHISA|nr:hypothetical protein HPB52_004760 [Rhipicephalus sanguineus]
MERAKNKRASLRSQSTRIVNEVNQFVQSDQFELSTLHILHSRLKAVQTELAALNAELETFLTDEQVAEDYDSVMEYEDAATSALALLEHHMNRLKVSSPASTAHPPATTTEEDAPATSEREPTRPQLSLSYKTLVRSRTFCNAQPQVPTTRVLDSSMVLPKTDVNTNAPSAQGLVTT